MPPIGKENFPQAIEEIARSRTQVARFIKSPEGDYWYETGKTTHEKMANQQAYIPIDAGRIGWRRGQIGIGADSSTLNISEDNPERAKTIEDFRYFAEGTDYTIVDF